MRVLASRVWSSEFPPWICIGMIISFALFIDCDDQEVAKHGDNVGSLNDA